MDSNVWIKAFMPRERQHVLAKDFVRRVGTGQHRLVLPYSVVVEVVVKLGVALPAGQFEVALAERHVRNFFKNPQIEWLTIDGHFAHGAALFGAQYQLRGMDALVPHAAMEAGCDLVTADKDFNKFRDLAGVLAVRRLGTV